MIKITLTVDDLNPLPDEYDTMTITKTFDTLEQAMAALSELALTYLDLAGEHD